MENVHTDLVLPKMRPSMFQIHYNSLYNLLKNTAIGFSEPEVFSKQHRLGEETNVDYQL